MTPEKKARLLDSLPADFVRMLEALYDLDRAETQGFEIVSNRGGVIELVRVQTRDLPSIEIAVFTEGSAWAWQLGSMQLGGYISAVAAFRGAVESLNYGLKSYGFTTV